MITGNLGFVGTETQKYLIEQGFEVVGFDLMEGKDIRDLQQLKDFIEAERPDRILHLAAIARFDEADSNPRVAFETNGLGCEKVAYAASKYHVPVVYTSTGSVYMPVSQKPPITENFNVCGNSVYGCSKYLGELYIKQYTPWMILRYAHLYGKEKRSHGLVGGFIDRINRGLAPVFYGGKQSNDFIYIKDVVRANFLALTASYDRWNQVYNIGTGEELTTESAGNMICEIMDYKGDIKKEEARIVDADRFVYDMSKTKRLLGFEHEYDFKKGLIDMTS